MPSNSSARCRIYLSAVAIVAASCSSHAAASQHRAGTPAVSPADASTHAPAPAPASTSASASEARSATTAPSAESSLPDGTLLPETSGLATFAAGKAWIPREQFLVAFSAAGRPVATVPLGDRGKITFRSGRDVCVAITGTTICVDSATAKVVHRYAESLQAAGFGSLWGFSPDGLSLLRVDPTRGTVTGKVAVEATTNWAPLISTGSGAVWVSSGTEHTLLRIDPSTLRVTARIHGFGQIDSLLGVACGYGKVWVQQNANGAGVLYRIDPATARITGHTALGHAPEAGNYGGSDIAIADGSVWTADSSPTVTRVDPTTLKVQKVYDLELGAPEWVAVGLGSIWTAKETDTGTGDTQRLRK